MRIFSKIYNRVMVWAQHRHATKYLMGLSFTEASFFPIPPDVMLAPMALAKPDRAWTYAGLTTLSSVLGGLFGYLIGMFFIAMVLRLIQKFGYFESYQYVQQLFNNYGFVAIFVGGFTPIPYKIFTIAAGATHMNIFTFTFASIVGRGARYFLVAGLMYWGGERMEGLLRRYVDIIGWVVLALIVPAIYFLR